MPPAAPASISSRRSLGVSRSSRAQERAEPGADLRDRPLLAGRAARADRDDRGDGLDQRDPAADLPAPRWKARIMASVPCPSASGAQREDEQARDQAADRRDQQHQPPGPGIGDRVRRPLAGRRQVEVEQAAEHVADHPVEQEQERRPPPAPRSPRPAGYRRPPGPCPGSPSAWPAASGSCPGRRRCGSVGATWPSDLNGVGVMDAGRPGDVPDREDPVGNLLSPSMPSFPTRSSRGSRRRGMGAPPRRQRPTKAGW